MQRLRHHLLPLAFALLSAIAFTSACSEVEDALDGEEAALKEADLPNCSKVITCCDNLQGRSFTPSQISSACSDQFEPAANAVIDTYQSAKSGIQDNTQNNDMTLDELRTQTQDQVEPGCRCFLEETIGTIDAAVLPKDCEADTSTGSLDEGAMCSDATDALFDAASN